jgi:hypothetical protein
LRELNLILSAKDRAEALAKKSLLFAIHVGSPAGRALRRFPDFLFAASPTAACAAFCKESRIKVVGSHQAQQEIREIAQNP